MNSANIDNSKVKVINFTLNGLNTLILAISSNYKLIERIDRNYKDNIDKLTKSQHNVERYLMKNEVGMDGILDNFHK